MEKRQIWISDKAFSRYIDDEVCKCDNCDTYMLYNQSHEGVDGEYFHCDDCYVEPITRLVEAVHSIMFRLKDSVESGQTLISPAEYKELEEALGGVENAPS
jgi:hypothetical protein